MTLVQAEGADFCAECQELDNERQEAIEDEEMTAADAEARKLLPSELLDPPATHQGWFAVVKAIAEARPRELSEDDGDYIDDPVTGAMYDISSELLDKVLATPATTPAEALVQVDALIASEYIAHTQVDRGTVDSIRVVLERMASP